MPKSARDVIAEWLAGDSVDRAESFLLYLSEAGFVIIPKEAKKRTSDAPSEPGSQ